MQHNNQHKKQERSENIARPVGLQLAARTGCPSEGSIERKERMLDLMAGKSNILSV